MTQQDTKKNNQTLTDFLTENGLDLAVWFISVSVTQDTSSQELLQIIRSKLPDELEKHGLHAALKYQLRKMIQYIHNSARQTQSEARKAGNDVFVTFRFQEDILDRSAREDTAQLLQERSFPVANVAETNLSVAHIPDLTYLGSVSKDQHTTAVLDNTDTITATIDPEYIVCYSGKKVSPEKIIWKEKNIYSKPEGDEYIELFNVSAHNSVIHSTGNEKVERTFQSGLLLFVKNELERIQKQLKPQSLDLFFSQTYAPLTKNIRNHIESTIVTKDVQFSFISSDEFTSIDSNMNQPRNTTIEELPKVQSNQHTTKNLHEACVLMRQGNVDTVYISSQLDQSGYITPNSDCYSYPVKGSKKVKSIRPWLIKSAVNISADVIVSNDQNMSGNVLAIPRFSITS